MHAESPPPPYTLYHGTVVHTPVLGELRIQTNMLVGVTHEGRIDYFSHYGDQQQLMHKSPEAFFEWQTGYTKGEKLSNDTNDKSWERGPNGGYRNPNRGSNHRYQRGYDFIDFSKNPNKFLVPGFFDTHIHASQYPNIGVGSELPLLDWLKKYTFELENKFKAPGDGSELAAEKIKRMRMAKNVYTKIISRTLSAGTTTASYFATIDTETTNLLADLAVDRGQRTLIGKVCMDCNPTFPAYIEADPEALVSGTVDVLKHCSKLNTSVQHSNGPKMVQGIVTPRFAPTCLSELMKKLGALASEYNAPVQTHISENKDEVKLVADLFPDCNDYTSVYDSHGLLGALTILAHAVHLTRSECKMILQRNCSILHCPSLNTFLTSGVAPVRRYLYEDKINVSLGTDISGGCEHSILQAMKGLIMVLHHRGMDEPEKGQKKANSEDSGEVEDTTESNSKPKLVTVADALYMATLGGAIACDMGKELGSFEMGKWFDAQLIDIQSPDLNIDIFDFQEFSPDDPDYEEKIGHLVHKWVFCGDDRNCVKVWCNGRKVVDKEDRWVYLE